jgi:plastocyanin
MTRAPAETARRLVCLMGVAACLAVFAPAASAAAKAKSYVVTMSNMNYGDVPQGLKVGDTITWVNNDTVPHTVTARDKSFDLRLAPGKSEQMTLSKAGSFPFFCIYHATMRGVLNVAAN